MRVIIIGSGIAGLAAAIALRKVGIEVTVYERAPELREVGAGISLWANAIRALDYLGAGDAVRARALALDRSELRAEEGRRLQAAFSGEAFAKRLGIHPFVAMIHRADLVAALAGLLPAGMARYGCECVGLEPHGNRAVVRFANGLQEEADVVVGADGIRIHGPGCPVRGAGAALRRVHVLARRLPAAGGHPGRLYRGVVGPWPALRDHDAAGRPRVLVRDAQRTGRPSHRGRERGRGWTLPRLG